ncbi:MAG: DUF4830 domain-containing protein [Acutalibacteraceae bacterium]|nr:DUF4830 domain-containing protein [Acutalibacteraceae bacterium]
MYVIKRIDKKGIVAMIVAVAVVVFVILKFVVFNISTTAYCDTVGEYQLEITSDFTIEDFFKQFELEIDKDSQQKVNITIPSEFNDVYEKYNNLQKSQGLDLVDYKGKNAERYTYNVTNYPNDVDVNANIIIYENRVVAGDLCTVTLDGIMTTLDDKTIGQEQQ